MKKSQFRIHGLIAFVLILFVLYMKVFMADKYSNVSYIIGGVTIFYLVIVSLIRIKEINIENRNQS